MRLLSWRGTAARLSQHGVVFLTPPREIPYSAIPDCAHTQ
jgi:hypothetical protein